MLLSLQTFDETMRSGCMELTVTGVSYNIHMSTVSIINGRNVEGRLSDVTGETSVFVPKPGSYYTYSNHITTQFSHFHNNFRW